MQKPNNNNQNRIRINNFIRVPQVRVIQEDGTSLGVMNTYEALKLAREQGLDLIEINPKAMPPVCKIVDYGKYKYEEKKKLAAAKKNQKISEMKEITLRPNTDENDLNHKIETAKQFLLDGDRVRFTIRFRGREITHPQIGEQKLQYIASALSEVISGHTPISFEGKLMSFLVSPK